MRFGVESSLLPEKPGVFEKRRRIRNDDEEDI